jgi:hypothetical protein
MRERIANRKISKEVRGQLPVVPAVNFKERGCSYCPYYAGSYLKQPRCMMAVCGWDDEREIFHPILRQMLPELQEKMERAKAKYEEAKEDYDILLGMFAGEMQQEKLEQDRCYGCCYSKCGPCIGVCYKALKEGQGK